jgi:HlyD family secretion protein
MRERTPSDPPESVLGLDLAAAEHFGRAYRPLLLALATATALGALGMLVRPLLRTSGARYATQPARRGDLVVTVTATGTLQPIDQVDVGSELSGTVRSVEVGYNDTVHAGQVIARLDTTRLEAQVLQSKASLESAQASVEQARANLAEAESQLARLEHVHQLSGGKIPSEQELVAGKATRTRAVAALASAEAAVAQAKATLEVQQTDLSRAVIRSPIDGIVLTASVRPGQTVAASLQAPLLFTLARDLRRLELDLSVDEADVGQVKAGQKATFTVDAWPGRAFSGSVEQVRYAAHTLGGVVTYETILVVDNPDLALRPGMTATAAIEVRRDGDVLLVPNAALRFAPADFAPRRPDKRLGGLLPPSGDQFELDSGQGGSGSPRVWVGKGSALHAVPVEPVATDGSWTEIASGAIEPGTKLVVAARRARGSP